MKHILNLFTVWYVLVCILEEIDIYMKKYFTISEFAKLRNVNINSLRYYEKIGVLRPCYVDKKTGYRYYSPEQVAILDVVQLCTNFGMPLKNLADHMKDNNAIDNKELFETGKKMAQERISDLQDELSKIEYTLNYLNNNQRYSEEKGFYSRNISARTIVYREYTGSLTDVRKVEMESGELYNYAQSKKYSPVFPAGLLISYKHEEIQLKIFFEIVRKNIDDAHVITIPSGEYQCCQVDLTPKIGIQHLLNTIYGSDNKDDIIISNMLLEKYQIGSRKSELQKRLDNKS